MTNKALSVALLACCSHFAQAGQVPDFDGAWAGGFELGDRLIPYIVRIPPSTGAGEVTLDRLDRIGPPAPASSVETDGDSLHIVFAGVGSGPWEFVLQREGAGLSGALVIRQESAEQRFPASFEPMTWVGDAALARVAGLYGGPGGARVRLSAADGGTLHAHFLDGDRFQMLFPADPTSYFAGAGPTRPGPQSIKVRFSRGKLKWTEAGTTRTYRRVESPSSPMALADETIRCGPRVMPLQRIPAGTFEMGQRSTNPEVQAALGLTPPEGQEIPEPDPLRRTTLSRPFLMSRFEVTNDWFAAFVDETGYMTDAERAGYGQTWNGNGFDRTPGVTWRRPGWDARSDAPAVFVSWNDASAFVAWLTRRLGRPARLPTEAEWEYACAAGTTTLFSCGDDQACLDDHAWSARNATAPNPVGTRSANPWGLSDMHGNVWEWCADGYAPITAAPATDPAGPPESRTKILRGGSWINGPWSMRTAYRGHDPPWLAEPHIGFRVVVEAGP